VNLSRKELEAAPGREGWQGPSDYTSIYLLPGRRKHDSGYSLIQVVGVKDDGSLECAAWCDDICWKHSPHPHGRDYTMRTDMTYPGGVVHCWGWDTRFTVGASLSSTDISVRHHKKEKEAE
jgi:hypothetical protein